MKPITLLQYHELAMRTSPRDGHDKVDNGMLGLLGETGELVDILKKMKYQSTPEADWPREAIIDELGDVLWYLEEMADGIGTSMEQMTGLSFEDLDVISREACRPTVEKAILSLSSGAHEVRKSIQRKDRKGRNIQMKNMLRRAAYLAQMPQVPMERVARRNIEKLMRRYPQGFDAAISMARYKREGAL